MAVFFLLYIYTHCIFDDMKDLDFDLITIERLFKKYRLLPITLYAKVKGVTRATVYNRIKRNDLRVVTFGGIKFVIEKNEFEQP